MTDDNENVTQEEVNALFTKLEGGVKLFTSQITAQADKAKLERVNGIVQLAIKAGKEGIYPVEKLLAMVDETLEIVENSLNDLLKEMDKTPAPEGDGGVFNDRGGNTPEQVSNYGIIDGLADMISHAWGFPILNDEDKEEVRIEHVAAGLEY